MHRGFIYLPEPVQQTSVKAVGLSCQSHISPRLTYSTLDSGTEQEKDREKTGGLGHVGG
jgi:hypothetical protein